MTDPNEPDGIDTGGSTVPPYEGRRTSADVAGSEEAYREGARVGGATGPVADASPAAPAPDVTGSPADEQPAADAPETDRDDDRVGPAHQAGTPRGEEQA